MPTTMTSSLSTVEEVLDDLRAGKMVVLVDDEDRENEGDLIMPAQFVTPEAITFMLTHARGYLCLCLTEGDCERLDLPPQSPKNTSVRETPFTVSIDGHPKHGFTTGVSAHERAKCIQMAIDPHYGPDEFVRPGHINPLRSRDGGTLVRIGQTEGSVDLCRLAGLRPQAVLLEIMRDDGQMARRPDLEVFCEKHRLKMCSIAQVIQYRLARESLVKRIEPVSGTPIKTAFGEFNLIAYESQVDALPQLALTVGGVGALGGDGHAARHDEPVLVRMHRRDLLGDVFHDLSTSGVGATADTLHAALKRIATEGRGAVVYLRPEGLGDGLSQRLTAIRRPAGMRAGMSSQVPMHLREFGIGGQILRDLGLSRLRLLTNHPKELPGLEAFGLEIVDQLDLH
ncbi:MAG: 3,4-dihydroxy-2-butanone-4-phosphate synthase [Phycisphaerales bacterium]|nr:3,4-dihydroxy-2-butanone-4-phosphate synthase [Phycisphaerales bacterium]